MMYTILMVIFIVLLLYLFMKNRYSYWRKLGVPYQEPKMFFGNVKDLITLRRAESDVLEEIYREMKSHPYHGIFYLWRPALVVTDVELAKRLLVTDFEYFVNHPAVSSSSGTDRIGHSLFLMRDGEWKEKRAALGRVFTPRRLKEWYAGVEENCGRILPLVEGFARSGEDVELESLVQRYAIDVITQTLFGLQTDTVENPNSEFVRHGRLVASPPPAVVLRSLLYLLAPDLARSFNLNTFHPSTWHFFFKFVSDVVTYREENHMLNEDLLSVLIKMKNGEGATDTATKMTLEEITGHVYAFFLAGYDTTTLTTSYCLYELSANPDVQEKLREEVDRTLKNHGGKLSYEAVQSMPFMDMVLAETLRKYPPAGVIKRECSKDFVDPDVGLRISKGTLVIFPVQSIQNDPDHFPRPERFDPSRFAAPRDQSTYFPFGKGPRICLGMKLAEMEVKVALGVLLSRYRFEPSSKMVTPIKFDPKTVFISVRPANGLWVKIKHRETLT